MFAFQILQFSFFPCNQITIFFKRLVFLAVRTFGFIELLLIFLPIALEYFHTLIFIVIPPGIIFLYEFFRSLIALIDVY